MRRSHLRLGIRLARRELRRRPWRTALVLLMVLIPSVAMTLIVISIRTSEWDAQDRQRAERGRVDANAYPAEEVRAPTQADLAALHAAFPPGTRMQVSHVRSDRVRSADRRTYLDVYDTRIDDPMNEGRFGALTGRLPRTGAEVAVTTPLADDLDIETGDRFRLDRLGRQVRVVGIVRPNSSVEAVFLGAPLPDEASVGTHIGFDIPDRLDPERVVETTRADGWEVLWEGSNDDHGSGVFWVYLGGGVGLIVLGTIITAAFAVGARRQLRSIGLLTASGAAPVTVKWFLVAQGALAGLIGSVSGAVLAIVGTRFVPDEYVEDLAGRPIAGPVVRLADLLPIIAIGTVVAAGASWLPARTAARVPTLQALAGRRPLPKVPRRLPVLGAGAVGAGCALLAMAVAGSRRRGTSDSSSLWALVAIAGGLAVVMGAIAIAPWVVAQLEWLGRGLRPGGRLASRSLARNRVRSSAVIGAICAVAIVVVTSSTLFASSRKPVEDDIPYLRTDQILFESSRPFAGETIARPAPDLVDRVRRAAPGSVVIPLRTPKLPRPTVAGVPSHGASATLLPGARSAPADFRGVVVASDPLVEHFAVPAPLRAALDRGEVIMVTRAPAAIRSARIHLPLGYEITEAPGPELPFGGSFESPHASEGTNYVLIGRSGLERAGLGSEPSPQTLIVLPDDMPSAVRERLELVQDDMDWEYEERSLGEEQWFASLYLPDEPPPLTGGQIKALLLAVATLVVLGVVAVGLALAAQDETEERQILDAVGAPPRTVRRATALKAGLLVFIAGALAVPAGLLPAASIVAATTPDSGDGDWTLRVDAPSLVVVLVVVPLVAGLVTWAGGRFRSWVRPKRPDVFAFGE